MLSKRVPTVLKCLLLISSNLIILELVQSSKPSKYIHWPLLYILQILYILFPKHQLKLAIIKKIYNFKQIQLQWWCIKVRVLY